MSYIKKHKINRQQTGKLEMKNKPNMTTTTHALTLKNPPQQELRWV
jgi:hypothetical protein